MGRRKQSPIHRNMQDQTHARTRTRTHTHTHAHSVIHADRVSLQQGSVLTRGPQGKPDRIFKTGFLNPFSWAKITCACAPTTHRRTDTHARTHHSGTKETEWRRKKRREGLFRGKVPLKKNPKQNRISLILQAVVHLCLLTCECFILS